MNFRGPFANKAPGQTQQRKLVHRIQEAYGLRKRNRAWLWQVGNPSLHGQTQQAPLQLRIYDLLSSRVDYISVQVHSWY